MSSITVTFDPEDVLTPAMMAHDAKLGLSAFKQWVDRNHSLLPAPLFSYRCSPTRSQSVWRSEDAKKIVDLYTAQRRGQRTKEKEEK